MILVVDYIEDWEDLNEDAYQAKKEEDTSHSLQRPKDNHQAGDQDSPEKYQPIKMPKMTGTATFQHYDFLTFNLGTVTFLFAD